MNKPPKNKHLRDAARQAAVRLGMAPLRLSVAPSKPAAEVQAAYTLYDNAFDTEEGRRITTNLRELAGYLHMQGTLLCGKHYNKPSKLRQPTLAMGVSTNGRRKDTACEAVTLLFLDADEVGEWTLPLQRLAHAGLAFAANRSTSDGLEDKIKWHLFIPLLPVLVPPQKPEFLLQYEWILSYLSGICIDDPERWLDLSTTDLMQPVFVGRRLDEAQKPRQCTYSPQGGALNWNKLLEATGYSLERAQQLVNQLKAPVVAQAPAGTAQPSVKPAAGETEQLIGMLRKAGLLGTMQGDKYMVLCPWRTSHTTGAQAQGQHDTSTVLFYPSGAFNCAHSHCTGRTTRDVLAELGKERRGALLSELWEQWPAATAQALGQRLGPEQARAAEALGPQRVRIAPATGHTEHAKAHNAPKEERGVLVALAKATSNTPALALALHNAAGALVGFNLLPLRPRSRFVLAGEAGWVWMPGEEGSAVLVAPRAEDFLALAGAGPEGVGLLHCPPAGSAAAATCLPTSAAVYLAASSMGEAREVATGLAATGRAVLYLPPPPPHASHADAVEQGDGLALSQATPMTLGSDDHRVAEAEAERPEIQVTNEIHLMVGDSLKCLAATPGVYQRTRMVVQVLEDTEPGAGVWRPRRIPEVREISEGHLMEVLSRIARWYRVIVSKGKDGTKDVSYASATPPGSVVSSIHTRAELHPIPWLRMVTSTPILRPDGTILDTPGYDPSTGVLYVPTTPPAQVPTTPTAQDVAAAVSLLLGVVSEFPFRSSCDRSAWLAGLLTRLARLAIPGSCPLFLVEANSPGTGKSLLVDLACLITEGGNAPRLRYAGNADEDEKRIFAILREGAPIVLFDNISPWREFGGDSLDMVLTGTECKSRILGLSKTETVENMAVWWASGNNVRVGSDLFRRIVKIVLRALDDKPEQRSGWTHPDIRKYVLNNRPALVRAALVILRAWYAAGCPQHAELRDMGSFEPWSCLIRNVVVHAGHVSGLDLPDPLLATDMDVDEGDEKAAVLTTLLTGWRELCLDNNRPGGLTTGEASEFLRRDAEAYAGGPAPNKYRSLREVIGEMFKGNGDGLSLSNIGTMLKNKRFAVGRLRLPDDNYVLARLTNAGPDGPRNWFVEEVNRG